MDMIGKLGKGLAMGVSLALAQGGYAAPALTDLVSSQSYQLYRLPEPLAGRSYDQAKGLYYIDAKAFWELGPEALPEPVRSYLRSLSGLPDESHLFESVIEKEYAYSTKWTDRDHILTITDYEKTGSESHLNPYLGPIAAIPTEWQGIATYQLDFDGERLIFRSYAARQIFSLRRKYWAYLEVYLPRPEFRDQIKALVLVVSDPNEHLDDNGMYILVPKEASS